MKKQYKSLYPLPVPGQEGLSINYCGVGCALDVLGGKWKLLVLSHLFRSSLRFSEIRKSVPGISEKRLASALKEMEQHGLVVRSELLGSRPAVVYSVSEYGQSVRPVVEVLFAWGENHLARFGHLLLT
jgi:DNA-binding HxlR family transcriptional regulator